jgi:hypothetical protein
MIGMFALAAGAGCAQLWAQADYFRYESHGKRDPFVCLVGPEKTSSSRLEDVLSVEEVKLEGIGTGAKGGRTAILNGQILKTGDKVGEIEVVGIQEKSVILKISGKTVQVDLPEQGGFKSENKR